MNSTDTPKKKSSEKPDSELAGSAERNQQPKSEAPTFWQIVFSTLASFFGVQSQKNRERDFQHGHPLAFITAGLILTIVFIITVVTVVKLVLSNVGA